MSEQYLLLFKQLQQGDSHAYVRLYEELKREALSVAYSQLFDFQLAEDAVQEAFIRLCFAAQNFRDKSSPKTFILGIVKNTAREIKRKRFVELKYNQITKAQVKIDNNDDFIYMQQVLPLLKKQQREVILLHLQAQLTFKEISEILKIPESTLKSRYNKGIEYLRNMYMADMVTEAEA